MCATVPTEKSRNGHIAVAADGSSWIWIPDRSKAYLTRDKGASWQSCRGLPKNIRIIADFSGVKVQLIPLQLCLANDFHQCVIFLKNW
jgi:hypothetical protein